MKSQCCNAEIEELKGREGILSPTTGALICSSCKKYCVRKKDWREMSQIYYENGGGDEQYTPKYGVEVLLPHIQHLKDKIIWCPFDKEDSEFVKVLSENGFKVVYSHIEYGQDFFNYEPGKVMV